MGLFIEWIYKRFIEEVGYTGNQMIAYRRTGRVNGRQDSYSFIRNIISNGFSYSVDRNDEAGPGIYFVNNLESISSAESAPYGQYVFKCQIDTSLFLILDETLARVKYGKLDAYEQILQLVGNRLPQEIDHELRSYSGRLYFPQIVDLNALLHETKIAPHYIKGMIVNIPLNNLGVVPIVWDKNTIHILAYAKHDAAMDGMNYNWIPLDKSTTRDSGELPSIGKSYRGGVFDPKKYGFERAPQSVKTGDAVKIDGRLAMIKGETPEGIAVVYNDRRNAHVIVLKPQSAHYMRRTFSQGDTVTNVYTGQNGIVVNDNENGLFVRPDGSNQVSSVNDHDWERADMITKPASPVARQEPRPQSAQELQSDPYAWVVPGARFIFQGRWFPEYDKLHGVVIRRGGDNFIDVKFDDGRTHIAKAKELLPLK
jgi:hypothetical protein